MEDVGRNTTQADRKADKKTVRNGDRRRKVG